MAEERGLALYATGGDDLYCGRLLVKDFDGHPYLGKVMGFVPGGRARLWAVVYHDGDREELDEAELKVCVGRAAGVGTAKQQQQLGRQVELWLGKRESDLRLAEARDRKRRSQEVGRYAEERLAKPKPAAAARRNARSPGRSKTQMIVADEKDEDDEVEDVESGDDEDEEWAEQDDEGEDEAGSRRGSSASTRISSVKRPTRSYAEQDSESDDSDDMSIEESDDGDEVKATASKKLSRRVKAEAHDGKTSGSQAGRGGSSRDRKLDGTGGKKDEVIERVVRENAEKVKKLDQLRKSGQAGVQLADKDRERLLNMKVSRKRVSSESKNSAPKGDFRLGNPRLVCHVPPPHPASQGIEGVARERHMERFVISPRHLPSSGDGDESDGNSSKGLEAGREAYVYQSQEMGGSAARAGGDVQPWMKDLFAKIPGEFHIGLLVGDSGSGKSVFLDHFFQKPQKITWREDDAVIAHFESPEEASVRLMSVGLNAVPTWLKPFRILSNGEKFRATLARQMESGVTIDNYTCITNRNVAASTSVSLSRLIRRYGNQGKGFKNVVFSTSYADVVEWLSPDWVIFTDSRTLVVNATPCGGPAISVDWTVKDEDAINVSEDLVQAKQACQADEELSTPVNRNDFTDKVTEDFDFSFEGSVSFKLPKLDLSALPRDFKVGLLVGPSGSGKTSLLRKFGDIVEPRWEEGAAVIEHSCFGSVHEAQEVLAAVGLDASQWARPWATLSDGEKAAADMAALLAGDNGSNGEGKRVLIDEYTSLVDRRAARRVSASLAAYLLKAKASGVVLATCHKDVIPMLRSRNVLDWVLWTDTGRLYSGDALARLADQAEGEEDRTSLLHAPSMEEVPTQQLVDTLRMPLIHLKSCRVKHTVWQIFKAHHYLVDTMHCAARCTLFVWQQRSGDEKRVLRTEVVGFVGSLIQPGAYTKDTWRESRTVVLPDMQGLGLGPRLSDAVASLFFQQGYRYSSKTSHPRFSAYRDKSAEWRCTKKERAAHRPNWATPEQIEKFLKMDQRKRTTSAYEWIGNEQDRVVFKQQADADVYARWQKSKSQTEAVLKTKGGNGGKPAKAGKKSKGKEPEAEHGEDEQAEGPNEDGINDEVQGSEKQQHGQNLDEDGEMLPTGGDDDLPVTVKKKDGDKVRKKLGASGDAGQVAVQSDESLQNGGEADGKGAPKEEGGEPKEGQAGDKRGRHGGGDCGLAPGQLLLAKYKSTTQWYECTLVAQAESGKWLVQWADGDDEDTLKDQRHLKKLKL